MLIDTGCSVTLVSEKVINVRMFFCQELTLLPLTPLPLNVDVIIGCDVICEHGFTVDKKGSTIKLVFDCSRVNDENEIIHYPDFYAVFDSDK